MPSLYVLMGRSSTLAFQGHQYPVDVSATYLLRLVPGLAVSTSFETLFCFQSFLSLSPSSSDATSDLAGWLSSSESSPTSSPSEVVLFWPGWKVPLPFALDFLIRLEMLSCSRKGFFFYFLSPGLLCKGFRYWLHMNERLYLYQSIPDLSCYSNKLEVVIPTKT